MRDRLSNLRKAKSDDVSAIVKIHQLAFMHFFLTRLGGEFLHRYYRMVLDFPGGILLVNDGSSGLEGFAAGFVHPDEFYRTLKRRGWALALPTLLAVLRNPMLVGRVLYNIRRIRTPREPRPIPSIACELSSVAVRPEASGKGVGKDLIGAFLEEAWVKGAEHVYLTTDAHHNDSANAFYGKLGFRLHQRFEQYEGRIMNEYVIHRRPLLELQRRTS